MCKKLLIDIFNNYEKLIELHKSIYIVGKSGLMKTTHILKFLKENNYDYSYTSLQQIKTTEEITTLLKSRNICSLFHKANSMKKKVLIIDNIDYLQNTEKKVLGNILKLLKSKEFNLKFNQHCILFIGNNLYDKKQIELSLCVEKYVSLNEKYAKDIKESYNIQAMKKNVLDLLHDNYNKGINLNNEKTIISLCYHENIIKVLTDRKVYEKFLENLCNGDYYDRVSFQKQLWQFNEMTFYLKVLYNYQILHNHYKSINYNPKLSFESNNLENICFTKVLTKYSNEYSNNNFLINAATCRDLSKFELYHIVKNKNEFISRFSSQEIKRMTKLFLLGSDYQ